MPGKAAGRAAAELPWLCPQTDSLIGLAEQPATLARLSAADPALLTFLLRLSPSEPFSLSADRFQSPSVLDTANHFLASTPAGWSSPLAALHPRRVADRAAVFARRIAERTRVVSPESAEIAARLAPLGWFAVAAVDAQADDVNPDAIARRLALRWRLPAWVGTILGNLNLPLRAGRTVAADADLFAVVQLAVHEAEIGLHDLGLTRRCDRQELVNHLRLRGDDDIFRAPAESLEPPSGSTLDPNPHRVPLLPNLLRATADSRRRSGAALVVRLEDRVDQLTHAVGELSAQDGDRLRDAKLAGLAEFAAGAGHEINNPLAVISSHAQRLARTESDPERAESLQTIIRQTQRVHSLLRDMMQFARPPQPEAQRFLACDLLIALREELSPFAASRSVRLEVPLPPADVWVDADVKQVRHAVSAVVRNGIEAAPPGGWVRVACVDSAGRVEVFVEDSGPGLSDEALEHAFDPFYCGKSAGRGRGLGLSTAWQLARQNGGDVRHETNADGPTRFVVALPRACSGDRPERLSA